MTSPQRQQPQPIDSNWNSADPLNLNSTHTPLEHERSKVSKHMSKPRGPYSSTGIHMFRCMGCGFETVRRERFESHSPCSGQLGSYALYTCSRCRACSTSMTLMQEHGELCHSDQNYEIEESMENFKPSSNASASSHTEKVCPLRTPMTHMTTSSSPENPRFSTPLSSTLSPDTPWDEYRIKQTLPPSNEMATNEHYLNSFMGLFHFFNQRGKDFGRTTTTTTVNQPISSKPLSTEDKTPASANKQELTCPMCRKSMDFNLEHLAKHLTLVHLLPLPAVLNYLSTVVDSSALKTATNTSMMATATPPPTTTTDHQSFPATIFNEPSDQHKWNIPNNNNITNNNSVNSTIKAGLSPTSNLLPTTTFGYPSDLATSSPSSFCTPIERGMKRVRSPAGDQTRTRITPKSNLGAKTPQPLPPLLSVPPPPPPPSSNNTNLTCPQCNAGFQNMHQLHSHFMQLHSDELGAIFNFSTALNNPMGQLPSLPPPFNPMMVNPMSPHSMLSAVTAAAAAVGSVDTGSLNAPPNNGQLGNGSLPFPATPRAPRDSSSMIPSNPLVPPGAMMNLQFAALAAAFGMPPNGLEGFTPSLPPHLPLPLVAATSTMPLMPPMSQSQQSTLFQRSGNGVKEEEPNMVGSIQADLAGCTPVEYKRSRLDPCVVQSGSLSNGSQLQHKPQQNQTETSTSQGCFPWSDWKSPWPLDDRLGSNPVESGGIARLLQPHSSDVTSPIRNDLQIPPNLLPQSTCSEMNSINMFTNQNSLSSETNGGLGRMSQMNSHGNQGQNGTSHGVDVDGHYISENHLPIATAAAATTSTNSPSPGSIRSMASKTMGDSQQTKAKSRDLKKISFSTSSLAQSDSESGPSDLNENNNQQQPQSQQQPIMNGAVHNTLRKTRSDMKVIHRYMVQVKHDNRDIHLIPYYELDQYIQDFVLTAKKKDGHEYEPESLKAFVHSLERHLKQHDYPYSVLKGNAFTGTRVALNQRLNELRALSRSGGTARGFLSSSSSASGKRATDGMDSDPMASTNGSKRALVGGNSSGPIGLNQSGLLGKENPQAILNSLWLINRTQFNIGGTQRHRNLVWGQFQIVTDEMGTKAIKFTPLFESAEVRYCRGYGGPRGCHSSTAPTPNDSKRQPLPFNCVELFEFYDSLRPPEVRGVHEPFYLCPDPMWEQTGNWFKTNAAGSQLLSRIPRILGLKQTREPAQTDPNHSAHKLTPFGLGTQPVEHIPDKWNRTPLTNSPSAFPGQSLVEKQTSHQMHRLEEQMNLAYSSLRPNFPNIFPLLFPPNMGSTAMPNALNLPQMPSIPLSTPSGYLDLAKNNPLSTFHFNCDKDYFTTNTTKTSEQLEADDLSQSVAIKCDDIKADQCSPEQQHDSSPHSNVESVMTGLDDTPSPVDTENWPAPTTGAPASCATLDREDDEMIPVTSPSTPLSNNNPQFTNNSHHATMENSTDMALSNRSSPIEQPIDMSGSSSPVTHSACIAST